MKCQARAHQRSATASGGDNITTADGRGHGERGEDVDITLGDQWSDGLAGASTDEAIAEAEARHATVDADAARGKETADGHPQ
jgi:hypothetical protein